MSYTITPHGWFEAVNGCAVQVADATHLSTTTYVGGFGKGILFHYTCGFQSNIIGSMEARGYATAPFSVGREGQIYQYLPIDTAGYHAYDASHFYIGIEHEAYPGKEDLTDLQLGVSAKLCAAIIERQRDAHGFTIPIKRIPGCNIVTPGFKEHKDGVAPKRCSWDPMGHSDGLYLWTWPRYLAAVKAAGEEEDVSFEEFKRGWKEHRAGQPVPGKEGDEKFGWEARKEATSQPAPGAVKDHHHETGGALTVKKSEGK